MIGGAHKDNQFAILPQTIISRLQVVLEVDKQSLAGLLRSEDGRRIVARFWQEI